MSAMTDPEATAVALHAGSGRGSKARAVSIGFDHRGSGAATAAIGSASARSAPSGMQVSLQTSQSARAASIAVVPGFASRGTAIGTRCRTSPS